MILSFPEYLSGGTVDSQLRQVFAFLNLILSLPVVFYCSTGYFRSAAGGLRKGIFNIDVPIAIGIAIVFLRSVVDIVSGAGPGFLDSLSGLVFFLLLGRLFQNKTYDSLNFDRSYTSYFPLAVTTRHQGTERTVPVSDLRPGDRMVIRNNEIVPADAVLIGGEAAIDYSFVTGESRTVQKVAGDLVHAGGRQAGGAIELDVVTEVSQGYLTRLWNETAFAGHTRAGTDHACQRRQQVFLGRSVACRRLHRGLLASTQCGDGVRCRDRRADCCVSVRPRAGDSLCVRHGTPRIRTEQVLREEHRCGRNTCRHLHDHPGQDRHTDPVRHFRGPLCGYTADGQ